MVYEINLGDKLYIGLTGLELDERCQNMKEYPVLWLRGHAHLEKLRLAPLLGRRVPWKLGLAVEAARTATAWSLQPEVVRGGPWCLRRLSRGLVEEAKRVAEAVRRARGPRAEAEAVWRVAKEMSRSGALCRHLRGECFKCGVFLGLCRCRTHRAVDLGLDAAKPRSGRTGHQHRKANGCVAGQRGHSGCGRPKRFGSRQPSWARPLCEGPRLKSPGWWGGVGWGGEGGGRGRGEGGWRGLPLARAKMVLGLGLNLLCQCGNFAKVGRVHFLLSFAAAQTGWVAKSKQYKLSKWGPVHIEAKSRDNRKYPGRSGRRR